MPLSVACAGSMPWPDLGMPGSGPGVGDKPPDESEEPSIEGGPPAPVPRRS